MFSNVNSNGSNYFSAQQNQNIEKRPLSEAELLKYLKPADSIPLFAPLISGYTPPGICINGVEQSFFSCAPKPMKSTGSATFSNGLILSFDLYQCLTDEGKELLHLMATDKTAKFSNKIETEEEIKEVILCALNRL